MMRCAWWFLLSTLTACAPFYQAKPLPSQSNIADIATKHPNEEGFKQYALKLNPSLSWPIEAWDLSLLHVAALYFHPALKVAKSDYAVALAGIQSAGLKPNIGINTNLDRSNQANGDISPWSYGLQIDLPVITANKRQINIEVAQHQAEIANIHIAETAWQLRHQLGDDLLTRSQLQAQIDSLKQLHIAQSELLLSIEKRLALGVSSRSDVLQIRLQQDQVMAQLAQLALDLQQVEQKIVHDAGLSAAQPYFQRLVDTPLNQLAQVALPTETQAPALWIQHQALTNRMDVQRGLAQYAKAEAQLKLQMAKRYPDLSISPGILYEYGDRIWALGLGGLFNLLNPASSLWAQAEQVRDNEAKRFYALQQQLIQQSQQVYLQYQQSLQQLSTLAGNLTHQQQRLTQLEHQWRAGLIDKTEWLAAKMQYASAQHRVVSQQAVVARALLAIENHMQRPLLFTPTLRAEQTQP